MPRVLIADDEANLRSTLARGFRSEGYEVAEARDGVEALSALSRGGIDVVLLDLSMPRMDGFAVLGEIRNEEGAPPVIVLTAHASLDNAVRAVREGAFDFVEKPPSLESLLLRVRRALERSHRDYEREEVAARDPGREMLGSSAAMRALSEQIARVAAAPARVLILGENGSGKELVARALHENSSRRGGPFVRVNCAALPSELFEAELFGHVKGAFTGALNHRRGRFERASGGTLFLDEIGEIPLATQPKLLRALEEGEIERVGAEEGTRVDVRVVAATNRDLPALVEEGRFRQDLYYRLEVVTLRVPPLRERTEDIPLLAAHFLAGVSAELGREPPRLEDAALGLLAAQHWPGNVRQLRNLMERIAILGRSASIGAREIREHLGTGSPAEESPIEGPLSEAVAAFERKHITATLERQGGNMAATARELGLERSSLYKKMRALGMRD